MTSFSLSYLWLFPSLSFFETLSFSLLKLSLSTSALPCLFPHFIYQNFLSLSSSVDVFLIVISLCPFSETLSFSLFGLLSLSFFPSGSIFHSNLILILSIRFTLNLWIFYLLIILILGMHFTLTVSISPSQAYNVVSLSLSHLICLVLPFSFFLSLSPWRQFSESATKSLNEYYVKKDLACLCRPQLNY